MGIDWSGILGGIGGAFGLGAVGTAVGGAMEGTTAGATGKGKLVGGTITAQRPGIVEVSAGGRTYFIKRAKHHRYHARRASRGTRMDKLMELAIMKSILKGV